jgi:hypothetical protein
MSHYVSKHQKPSVVEFWKTKGMQEHYTSIRIMQTRTATEKVVSSVKVTRHVLRQQTSANVGDIFPMRP